MTIFTSDVSSHDGPVDWVQARSAGISAACVKATEAGIPGGYGYTNPLFSQQYDGAVAAGMQLVGAYHCLAKGSVPDQIEYFTRYIGGRATQPGHWAMLDVEPFEELRSRGLSPGFADVEEFCYQWWSHRGIPLALYLPRWVWQEMGSPSLTDLVGSVRLVASNYPVASSLPFQFLYQHAGGDTGPGWTSYGGRTPTLWQYASTALIPGLRGGQGDVDVNAYRSDLPTLQQLLTGTTGPTPAPQPQGDDMLTHWNTIGRGATGDQVRVAQGLLTARGLTVVIDGIFGPATENGTKLLQGRYGIAIDGLFGAHTLSVGLYGKDLA